MIGTSALLGTIGAATALGGAIAGGEDRESSKTSGLKLGAQSDLERRALASQQNLFGQLLGLGNIGPGAQDVSSSLDATRNLASLFGQFSQTGGLPNQQDITRSNQIAQALFAPQQVQLQQAFQQQGVDHSRNAARLGRATTDPVLQGLLARSQTQQQALLNSQMGSAAQQLALALPQQRLGFAQQQASVLDQLSQQALNNRISLLGVGQNLSNAERQFRIDTAEQFGENVQRGSLGQGILGGLGGFTSGLKMGGNILSAFGGGL